MANYIRLVGGAHNLTPHAPAVLRAGGNPVMSQLLQDAFHGDSDALAIALDHLQDRTGRSLQSPQQLAGLNDYRPTLSQLLTGLHTRTLGPDQYAHPFDVEGRFSNHALAATPGLADTVDDHGALAYAHMLAAMRGGNAHPHLRSMADMLHPHLMQILQGNVLAVPSMLQAAHYLRRPELMRVVGTAHPALGRHAQDAGRLANRTLFSALLDITNHGGNPEYTHAHGTSQN